MKWLKKAYKDPGTWVTSAFLLIVFPLFSVAQWKTGLYFTYPWETAAFGVGMYFVMLLITYFKRNNP